MESNGPMEHKPLPPFRRLQRCDSGAEAIEFALLSPVLVLVLIGTVELGFAYAAQNLMESAMYQASRLGRTGYVETGFTQEETIVKSLSDRAGLMLNIDDVVITSLAYDEFDEIGNPEPFIDANGNGTRDDGENYTDLNGNGQWDEDRGVAGFGTATQIVVYTASYSWPIYTPLLDKAFGTNGYLSLSARAVVRNEPY